MPRVELVVPTRDRRALLQEAVESIEHQTFEDWVLVAVDDASTDDTAEWLGLRAARDERVRFLRLESHSERAAARNRGLETVTAEFVLFLDDDDRLTPRALERLVGGLSRHREAVEAIGARAAFDERGHRRRAHHVRTPTTRHVWPEMLAGWYAVPGQCLFRTEALRAAGGWSEEIAGPEDQELQLRLSKLGPAVFIPSTVLEYRTHAGQWRPYDAGLVEDAIHQQFVDDLAGTERERAMRLREAHELLGSAGLAYGEGRYRIALAHSLHAVQAEPRVLLSPLTGPPLAGLIGKAFGGSVLGTRLSSTLRATVRRARRALHRDPGGGVKKAIAPSSARRE